MGTIPPPPLFKQLLLPDGKSDTTWANWYRQVQSGIITAAPPDASYVTTQANGTLTHEVNLGALPTGYVLSTVSGGVATVSTTPTVAPGPHHTTHETGGSDAITSLAASVITSGTIPDARLSTNVAFLNASNVFTKTFSPGAHAIQLKSTLPLLSFLEDAAPANSKLWRLYANSSQLFIQATSDDEQSGASVVITRAGTLTAPAVATTNAYCGFVQVGSATPALSGAYPMLRADSASVLGVVKGDSSAYASVTAGAFNSQLTGNSLADLTVRGATNFAGGVTTTGGNINTTGSIWTTGQLYPGRVDVSGQQSSWFLASHGTYGLYCSTGLYCVGGLWCTAIAATAAISCTHIVCSGGSNSLGDLTVTGATNFQGGVSTSGGNVTTTGYVMSTSWVFPGRQDTTAPQTNWGLGSHASYGLYTNTGFFAAGPVWGASYPGPSDIRLKDDLGLATETSALRAVRVHDFTWKADGRRDRGVFAQELDPHIPSVVHRGKTAEEPWGVDYSKLVAHVIVGWQEHDRELAALKADLAEVKRILHAE